LSNVERLLDAALQVYLAQGEKGFTVTTVRDLSGVSMGSLYQHFGSLQGLRIALMERWTGVLITEMTAALQQHEKARDAIQALIEAYMRFVLDNRDAALFLHMADTDRDLMTRGRELRDLQEARLSPWSSGFGHTSHQANSPTCLRPSSSPSCSRRSWELHAAGSPVSTTWISSRRHASSPSASGCPSAPARQPDALGAGQFRVPVMARIQMPYAPDAARSPRRCRRTRPRLGRPTPDDER
jgi:AcrR family transcriptional regulator